MKALRSLGAKIKKVWGRWVSWRDKNEVGLPLMIIGIFLIVIGFLMNH